MDSTHTSGETMTDDPKKFYALIHPGAPGGVVTKEPEMREQDAEFEPSDYYAVVFFPKITGIGKAQVWFHQIAPTISCSPEAAKAKFMDRPKSVKEALSWEQYEEAGWKIRKIRISDLGDPS